MTITPTITTTSTPGLAITTSIPGMTYDAFLNDLGVSIYYITGIYILSTTITQLNNPIQYNVWEQNGNIENFLIIQPYSPKQYQPAILINIEGRNVVFDGQTGLVFNMMPNSEMQWIFFTKTIKNQDYIDQAGGINNIEDVQEKLGFSFYEQGRVAK